MTRPCPQCAFENPQEAAFCASCGYAASGPQPGLSGMAGGPVVVSKGLAIASLILGILSVPLLCAFGLCLLAVPIVLAISIPSLTA